MKTTHPTNVLASIEPKIMRLHLMDTKLTGMLSQLNSYRYEPFTSEMQYQYIKLHHEGVLLQQTISTTNENILNSVISLERISQDIDTIIKTYYIFQKSLSAYFLKVNQCN